MYKYQYSTTTLRYSSVDQNVRMTRPVDAMTTLLFFFLCGFPVLIRAKSQIPGLFFPHISPSGQNALYPWPVGNSFVQVGQTHPGSPFPWSRYPSQGTSHQKKSPPNPWLSLTRSPSPPPPPVSAEPPIDTRVTNGHTSTDSLPTSSATLDEHS